MVETSKCGGCEQQQCGGHVPAAAPSENQGQQQRQARLGLIRHKIMVLSGKGGVGKSTVAVNLALSLALAGRKVGLLDVDIHGPSIPTLLHLGGRGVTTHGEMIVPLEIGGGLKVMSIGLLLRHEDDAVIWRGPMKMNVIKQFLQDVQWGRLDYLVIDSPPGTGDEPLSVCQLIPDADGAVIVTTPQELALADVRKSINFCVKLRLPVLGIVENMRGFVCPQCGAVTDIFQRGGGEKLAAEMNVPFLGVIPLDPAITESGDAGRPYVYHYARTETAQAFAQIAQPFLDMAPAAAK